MKVFVSRSKTAIWTEVGEVEEVSIVLSSGGQVDFFEEEEGVLRAFLVNKIEAKNAKILIGHS